jgi:hypothetical protein
MLCIRNYAIFNEPHKPEYTATPPPPHFSMRKSDKGYFDKTEYII